VCEINGNQHPIGKVAEYLSIPSGAPISAPTPIVLSFLLDPEQRVSLYAHVAVCERTMNTPFANTLYYGDCLDIIETEAYLQTVHGEIRKKVESQPETQITVRSKK